MNDRKKHAADIVKGVGLRVIAGTTPVGLAALGAKGLYQAGKKIKRHLTKTPSRGPRGTRPPILTGSGGTKVKGTYRKDKTGKGKVS